MARVLVLSTSITALAAATGLGQRQPPKTEPATYSMAKEYREVQLSALETQRKLLLSMVDSMPERLLTDKATPAQRDFANQIYHVARSSGFVGSWWLTATMRPLSAADSTAAVTSKAGLKNYINQEYDFLTGLLKSQSDSDRDTRVQFFGGKMIPKWQVWDELNQHAIWTAGQVVANFRKHGMAPPSFLFF
jgi:hypothetical protein